ncbi:MAG: hypothetical protein HYV04_15855 [Deltaproteobacteria bacterium]|nr:hypothetical protein [Deltaproteobacteria bacterium]
MPRGKPSKGKCSYCGSEIAKSGATKRLSACPKRQAIIEEAERRKAKSETLHHLRVQDAWHSEFWLDLEARGSGTLKDLDHYLRRIWLECCGHMSRFSVGGWRGHEIPKKRRISEVFERGVELTHIYDFGTSSETLIKAVGEREGPPTTTRPIALMARNLMPEPNCIDCEQPAVWLCMECLTEEEQWGVLCSEHAQAHPHDNYGEPIRLVNSPRLGMCGYEGPGEPPY